jgi:hypothetical protein
MTDILLVLLTLTVQHLVAGILTKCRDFIEIGNYLFA